jgi:hypothetical protein
MTTLVKKKFLSESVRLAQSFAVEHYIDYGQDDQRPNELIFEQLSTLSFEEAEVSATGNYEYDDEDDLCERMREMAKYCADEINTFSSKATKGIQLATIAGHLQSEFENLDLQSMALLGSMLNVTVIINDDIYKLDENTAKWIPNLDESKSVEIDFRAGAQFMPKVEGDKRVSIGYSNELQFIVDQSE